MRHRRADRGVDADEEVMRKIKYVVVHHAARATATLETITHTHVVDNGWPMVGYQTIIERGKRRPGRPRWRRGAHTATGTRDINGTSHGICIADNCNKRLRPEDWAALIDECVDECRRSKLPASAVIGHRETPQHGGAPTRKVCPGKLVDLDRLRAEVRRLLTTPKAL